MLISNVYIRFFRSFNYDYLRKTHPDAEPAPWDLTDQGYFYPYVKVRLERGITTVVGGNESGKSQLLLAIKCALTGEGIRRGDFCRYSQFFTVDRSMRHPDFGLEFVDLNEQERKAVATGCGLKADSAIDSFALFRVGDQKPVVYIRTDGDWAQHKVTKLPQLAAALPHFFEINANIPLPDSVPIEYLKTGKLASKTKTRPQRRALLNAVLRDSWFTSPQRVTESAADIFGAVSQKLPDDKDLPEKLKLADDLLVKVAQIDRSAFDELHQAVEAGREGYANGIIEQVNAGLAKALNFPKWWSQDSEFKLLVTLRDLDLVFTVQDRTGTEYSFEERSGGLKYFLSYFVQYLAHEPPAGPVQEVLLMDEPDAYLSSMGQQDLLRVFEAFAYPDEVDRAACQVVYVTHSPFLIDKNHGERIRVLEKGQGDEGTRVVRNVARNHYEPLRSAFGGFVGETTFISNCNLMLEGQSDQILLAGMSAYLQRKGAPRTEILDLNSITLVPAGSASHIPYMVYLARGRDTDRPAVIVLLDSDKEGNSTKYTLAKGGPRSKRLIADEFILQLGDLPAERLHTSNPAGVTTIEDLIPVEIALLGLRLYVKEFLGGEADKALTTIGVQSITFDSAAATHAAVERAAAAVLGEEFHLDKVGFARSIIEVITREEARDIGEATRSAESNFRLLFRQLGSLQRRADREVASERISSKINRLRASFLRDHPDHAKREEAMLLLEDIEADLDSSVDAEALRSQLRTIRRDFELDELSQPVQDYDAFKRALSSLAYLEVRLSQEDFNRSDV